MRLMPAIRSLALAVIWAGSVSLTGCGEFAGCANSIVRQYPSPSGDFEATLFQHDCGATTAFASHVSIIPSGGAASGSGNAFVADTDHGAATAGPWGGPDIEVEWQGPDRIVIRYAENARIFKREAEVLGVSIAYRSLGH
jgi:hypothetical protein